MSIDLTSSLLQPTNTLDSLITCAEGIIMS